MYIDSSIEYTFKVNKRTDPIKICPLNTDNYYITWDKFQEVFLENYSYLHEVLRDHVLSRPIVTGSKSNWIYVPEFGKKISSGEWQVSDINVPKNKFINSSLN